MEQALEQEQVQAGQESAVVRWLARQTIDLAKRNVPRKYFPVEIPVGTAAGLEWEVSVTLDGEKVSLEDWTILGEFVRHADGATLPVQGRAEGNVARVTLDAVCSAMPGDLTGIMWATRGADEKVAIGGGRWEVTPGGTDTVIDPTGIVPDLTSLLAEIDGMRSLRNYTVTAADNAWTSSEKALQAASQAREAANEANIQALYATGATTLANEAAEKANTAAASADEAAKEAATAAGNAEDAALCAHADGDFAFDSAIQADRAADSARKAAAKFDTAVPDLVRRLTEPFAATGAAVTVYPVEGHPLDVTVTVEPTQEGVPTLEAPQPVTVAGSVAVTRSADSGSDDYTVALPEGFAGGTVDVTGGKATAAWARVVLDGMESWSLRGTVSGGNRFSTTLETPYLCAENELALCSAGFAEPRTIGGYDRDSTEGVSLYRTSSAVTGKAVYLTLADVGTVEALTALLAASPITLYYRIEEADPVDVEAVTIPGLPGENTVTAGGAGITVRGAEDPRHTHAVMMARIEALERA